MDGKNPINAGNISALFDLKAEYLRRKEAASSGRKTSDVDVAYTVRKTSLKPDAKQAERLKARIEEKKRAKVLPPVEDDALQKSRIALERKAKLYEQMSSGKIDLGEDASERFLVDFDRKGYAAPCTASRDHNNDDDVIDTTEHERIDRMKAGTDEDWVDYTDCLGRTRRCMRKDLPEIMAQDEELKRDNPRVSTAVDDEESKVRELLVDEKLQEKHTQWAEKEFQNANKESIHYGDVRFDEVRDFGAAHFDLSTDEDERRIQIDMLNKLREQTEKQKEASNLIKEKRKAMMEQRLAKIRAKKNLPQAPSTGENSDEEKPSTSSTDCDVRDTDEKDDLVLNPTVRPWDEGKDIRERIHYSSRPPHQLYEEERRSERPPEFAPPTQIYGPAPKRPRPHDLSDDPIARAIADIRKMS